MKLLTCILAMGLVSIAFVGRDIGAPPDGSTLPSLQTVPLPPAAQSTGAVGGPLGSTAHVVVPELTKLLTDPRWKIRL